ncbi:MAG: hypothetical protein COA47_04510 [Robiginitomaculum sp.]|nr:MAG: hypothetical protein COA47_04510 [Robiginitomaculum sp.]
MQRKYDYRLIKSRRPYTLASLAKLLKVHPATIRGWIKTGGLSVAVVDNTRPVILNGAKVKSWMEARAKERKRPCGPDEMYCVRCKSPRQIVKGSFRAKSSNTQKVTVMGDCEECGLTLRSFNTAANLDDLAARYNPKYPKD